MQVDQQFIAGLRRKLRDEMEFDDHAPSVELSVLAAFDRAALATVLNGSAPVVDKFRERGLKAARTRAKNKKAKEEGNAGKASDPQSEG